jgi:NAD(P)-dependent dehydrogenase (short-subunit alcohol dehydrogenase family)
VNFFGAVATLETLRPLRAQSRAPPAVAVSSFAALTEVDPGPVGVPRPDEERGIEVAQRLVDSDWGHLIYATSKRALVEWVREQSVTPEWAGAGIPLNAVGPGLTLTPMIAELLATEEGREEMLRQVPAPLNGPTEPSSIGYLLAWLTSKENSHIAGQVVFSDSGADAVLRGPRILGC